MKTSLTAVVAAIVVATVPLVEHAANAGPAGHDAAHHEPAAGAARATKHHAVGVVRSVDAAAGSAMIAHEPIASLGWPAMSMAFQVRDQRLLKKLRAGSSVEFEFEQTKDGFLVTAIK